MANEKGEAECNAKHTAGGTLRTKAQRAIALSAKGKRPSEEWGDPIIGMIRNIQTCVGIGAITREHVGLGQICLPTLPPPPDMFLSQNHTAMEVWVEISSQRTLDIPLVRSWCTGEARCHWLSFSVALTVVMGTSACENLVKDRVLEMIE